MKKYLQEEFRTLGTVEKENGLLVFKPINSRESIILVQDDVAKDALNKRVCCYMKELNNGSLTATIERVFGLTSDPLSENVAIAYKYGFSTEFSNKVLKEVDQTPQYVTEEDRKGRLNLEDKYFMPWDDKDCKDKDDAIYAEKTDFGYKVYVAIADVGHYVKFGTELDKEAFKRSTSCYLGSGVYPMLPPELSNGICSLNEKVSRLALVSIIDIDKNGKIINYDFKKSVIKIKKSISYDLAEKIHLCQENEHLINQEAKPYVDLMYEICDVLENKLIKRNRIEFTSNEPQFRFNKEKNIVEDIVVGNQERSHMVVEQFMILANEATSLFFNRHNLDGIYRIHQKPALRHLQDLNSKLAMFGVKHYADISSLSYVRILEEVKNHPAQAYLESIILESLKKAEYSNFNYGHFGLTSTGYTHFTSPIRRYSDLLAHRIIAEYLEKKHSYLKSGQIAQFCIRINYQEKQAGKAEAESNKYLACVWANQNIGKVVKANVIWFEDDCIIARSNTVDYIIPLEMGGEISSDGISIKDFASNKIITLGSSINIKIEQVDMNCREIIASKVVKDENILTK